MKHEMNKHVRTSLTLSMLIVVALVAVFLTFIYWRQLPRPGGLRPPREVPGDIELYYTIKTVFSTVNVTLLISLLVIYISIYRKTHSQFTVGLIIFSAVLLFYALSSNPLMHGIFGFTAFGLGPFAMLPDLFTCIALAMLLYMTVTY